MSFIRSESGVRWQHPQRMKFKQAGFCEITSRGGYSGPIRIRACLKILRDSLEDFLLLQDLRQKLLNSWIQTFEFFCYSDILKTYIYTYIYIYIYIYVHSWWWFVFYVLLTTYSCIILLINQTRCKILLNIFISLLYMFRPSSAHQEERITIAMRHWYFSLFFVGVWSAGWIESNQQTRRHTHTEWQIPVSHRCSDSLLMKCTWMLETYREEK